MTRVAIILGFSALVFLACGVYSTAPAQSRNSRGPTVAEKFDEFGSIHHCDLTARLDNLAIMVQNIPAAEAHIISYAPPGPGERLPELIKEYLIITRGLKAERIKTTYGGRNTDLNEPKIQLWIVPRNAKAPKLQKHDTNVETFKGLLAEQQAMDDFGVYLEPEMGPGISRTTEASVSDILRHQKNAVGYVVVYSGEDLTPGAWRRIAQGKIDYLKEFKVDSDRLKVIFGGHQKETRLQLWILPKDAPPPVADAGPELPLAKVVKAGDFGDYVFANEQNQTSLFRRLTDILSVQKTVRAFIVVRLEVPTPVEPVEEPAGNQPEPVHVEEEPSSQQMEEIPERPDLTKLVEKWRAELANNHKIGAERFIILFTTAREFESNNLSVWIVPNGQPLPDPNEQEEEPVPGFQDLNMIYTINHVTPVYPEILSNLCTPNNVFSPFC